MVFHFGSMLDFRSRFYLIIHGFLKFLYSAYNNIMKINMLKTIWTINEIFNDAIEIRKISANTV